MENEFLVDKNTAFKGDEFSPLESELLKKFPNVDLLPHQRKIVQGEYVKQILPRGCGKTYAQAMAAILTAYHNPNMEVTLTDHAGSTGELIDVIHRLIGCSELSKEEQLRFMVLGQNMLVYAK